MARRYPVPPDVLVEAVRTLGIDCGAHGIDGEVATALAYSLIVNVLAPAMPVAQLESLGAMAAFYADVEFDDQIQRILEGED